MQKVQYWLQPCMMLTNAVTDFLAVPVEQMLANRRLAPLLFRDVHHLVAPAGEDVIQVLRRAMELLRADHQVHVRQPVNQLLSPALGHAAHEAEHDVGPAAAASRR